MLNLTMKIRPQAFNTYLLLAAMLFAIGCGTPEERKRKKEESSLRLHLETNADATGKSHPIQVIRSNPVVINVEDLGFIDERDIEKATIEDAPGSFSLRIELNDHGRRVLEMVTTANKGRHYAVFSQFPDPRWLGAPKITKRISDGVIIFTPDASREECERLVRGLANVIKKLKNSSSL